MGLDDPAVLLRLVTAEDLLLRSQLMSSQGEKSPSRPGKASGEPNSKTAQQVCVHVVPLFVGAETTMSSGLYSNPSHRVLSSMKLRCTCTNLA